MAPSRRRMQPLVLIRADNHDEVDLGVVQGHTVNISKDGRRLVRSVDTTCLRVDRGFYPNQVPDWTTQFQPDAADQNLPEPRRYRNSDQNMLAWMDERRAEEYLPEMVRLEGRGNALSETCLSCAERLIGSSNATHGAPFYRCEDCWGVHMECLDCTLHNHARLPTHRILKWNGTYYEKTTLKALGLRVQFGHQNGRACVNPIPGHSDFTLLDCNGIYKLNADFCGCEHRVADRLQLLRSEVYPSTTRFPKTSATFRLLEQYEQISCSGKLSVYEHYQSLEHMTDNTRMNLPKSRYKSYLRMNRQMAHLKMMKRAGRGCVVNGIATTPPGGLALPCPACPREGVNLPENWRSIAKEDQYLHRIILAVDANFRLKNLRRPGTHDPGLHTGLAYFVENEAYLAHIAKYPRQKDISSCAGFKTMAHAETKNSTGLRSTGVGMAVCARHEIVCPNGVGDLQKGERYCNMDYIALSSVRHVGFQPLFWSYDISCQWSCGFVKRMTEMPPDLQLSPDIELDWGVPKCHCKGHKMACQVKFSMNIKAGVGRTDGEGIERTWDRLNGAAPATKEMLPGGRHDLLDRRIGAHNWHKLVRLADHINRRTAIAAIELHKHQTAHEEFTENMPEADVQAWETSIVRWEKNLSKENPYYVATSRPSEASVRQTLAEEERQAMNASETQPLHETPSSVMVSLALIAEDTARCITYLLGSDAKDSPAIVKEIHDKRLGLQNQIQQLRALQAVYMTCVAPKLVAGTGSRSGDIETEPLWLPSAFDEEVWDKGGCATGVAAAEEAMREAQCHAALDTIRAMQHAQSTIFTFRRRNLRGNRASGRSHAIVHRLSSKSDLAVLKYWAAREALLAFRGAGAWESELRILQDSDVRAVDSKTFEIDQPTKKRKMKENEQQLGSGSQEFSWIWLMPGAMGGASEEQMNGVVRLEWLKSRARVNRWTEESRLLVAEKGYMVDSLEYEAKEWERRAVPWDGLDTAMKEGLRALAFRQADMYRRLAAHAVAVWSRPPKTRVVPDRIEVREVEEEEEAETDDETEESDLIAVRALARNDADATMDDVD